MKTFIMRETLFGKDGIPQHQSKIPFVKDHHSWHVDQDSVLIFNNGVMYSGEVTKKKLESFRETVKEVTDLPSGFSSIKLDEIRKVLQRPSYSIGGDVYMHDNNLKFYRAIHVDTKERLSIPSSWLLNREVVDILSEYITKPGVRTDFDKIGVHLVPKKRMSIYGDKIERLPLGYRDFYWSEEKAEWVYGYDPQEFDN